MLCFVDIEHASWVETPEHRHSKFSYLMDVQRKLEEISGLPCIVQRYEDVTIARLVRLGVTGVIISGNATDWPFYAAGAFDEMYAVIRDGRWPVLGFCGGHQLIAMAHGMPVGPMRRLAPGEADPTGGRGTPGFFSEWGFMPVQVEAHDPLFDGFDAAPVLMEAHYCDVKQAPPGFRVLASTPECPIEMMCSVDGRTCGTQFHPEAYTERPHDRRNTLVELIYPGGRDRACPDGRRLLANYFRLAGVTA